MTEIATSSRMPPEQSPPFVSFAQNFEDVMLWRALRHISGGLYIDIGAGEPEADSVTKAFYDRGWTGINIEPAQSTFGRLAAARPRDRNLRLLVGDREGTQEFFLIGDENALSTTVAELAARHAVSGWACRTTTVPVTTLARICDQHVRGQIHFLKIDAEWSELAILRGADFERFRPWIVLYEATPIGTGPHSYEDCDRILDQAGYRFLYADGLNRFWVAQERHADLAPHFATPPNVLDGFVRASETTARTQAAAAQAAEVAARDEATKAAAELENTVTNLTKSRSREAEARTAEAAARDEATRTRAELEKTVTNLTKSLSREAEARTAEATARDEVTKARAELAQTAASLADSRSREAEARAAEAAARDDVASLRDELVQTRTLLVEQTQLTQRATDLADTLADAQATVAALQTQLDRTVAERDAVAQELYESNRYAAALTVERQKLLDHVGKLTAEVAHAHGHNRQQLELIFASASWRFAWPVRAAGRMLRASRRLPQAPGRLMRAARRRLLRGRP